MIGYVKKTKMAMDIGLIWILDTILLIRLGTCHLVSVRLLRYLRRDFI